MRQAGELGDLTQRMALSSRLTYQPIPLRYPLLYLQLALGEVGIHLAELWASGEWLESGAAYSRVVDGFRCCRVHDPHRAV